MLQGSSNYVTNSRFSQSYLQRRNTTRVVGDGPYNSNPRSNTMDGIRIVSPVLSITKETSSIINHEASSRTVPYLRVCKKEAQSSRGFGFVIEPTI
ncbi:hypothetical protein TNCV_1808241 [Trichonephila clavipes]|nr:hypothetical protein TNCV_1808241 [Trichonephila clavipes]